MGSDGLAYGENGLDGLDGKGLAAVGTHRVFIVAGHIVRDVCEKFGEECHFEELVVGKQVESGDGGVLQTRGKGAVGKCTSSLLLDGLQLGEAGIGESIRRGIDPWRLDRNGDDTGDGNRQGRDNRHAHLDDCGCE